MGEDNRKVFQAYSCSGALRRAIVYRKWPARILFVFPLLDEVLMFPPSRPWSNHVITTSGWQSGPGAPGGICFRPQLEALEDRTLLSAGNLDTTFGTGGKVVTDFGAGSINTVDTLAVQPDGKILVAGHAQASASSRSLLALARYNSDGTLDLGFGTGGKVTTDFDPLSAEAVGVCVEPSGKIIVVGQGPPNGLGVVVTINIFLSAYNSDGSPDMTFGTAGEVVDSVSVRQFSFSAQVTGVACQPDGKSLVGAGASSTSQFSSGGPTSIIRYNVDGSRDSTFGSGGVAGISYNTGQGIAVQPDGKIVAGVEHIYLLRLNPDGSPDLNFGSGGLAVGNLIVAGMGTHTIFLQPDGRIVCLGIENRSNSVTRFNVNGTLDQTFGQGGVVFNRSMTLSFGALQTDGKIVQATTTNGMFDLIRYDPNGGLDTSFGSNGDVLTAFDTTSMASLAGIVIQPDGKIVAAGTVTGSATNFGLVRYLVTGGSASDNERYVSQLYLDLLRRSADAAGLAHWTAFLDQGNSRLALVQMFEASPEYRALVVENLYGYILGRAVDSLGLNDKVNFLNQGGTAEQLEADLLGSDEYFSNPTKGNGKNDVFLQALYRDVLQRAIDPSGMAVWGQALMNGASRTAVAAAVLASRESDQMEVQALYSRFLRRSADSGGLDTFSGSLQKGVANEAVIAALLASDEYFSLAVRLS
jgi:uncharacterized delta-60 repeat protein